MGVDSQPRPARADRAPAQDLRLAGRGRRRVVLRRRGRDLRHPRPERRREDHHRRVRGRTSAGRRRARSGCSAWTRGPTGTGSTRSSACSCRRARCPPGCGSGEILDMYRSFYRDPADVGELIEALGLAGQARRLLQVAVGRPAAAAVGRARAHRPAEDRGARRDDHRPRPGRPPRGLGADRGHSRPRGDDPAGHPLHGGGRAAVRPGRADRRRARRRARHPGRPGRAHQRRQDRAVPALGPVRRPPADRAARGDPGRPRGTARASSPERESSSTR